MAIAVALSVAVLSASLDSVSPVIAVASLVVRVATGHVTREGGKSLSPRSQTTGRRSRVRLALPFSHCFS